VVSLPTHRATASPARPRGTAVGSTGMVFEPLPYPGQAIRLYGRDSELANYWLNALDDELLYRLAFEEPSIETIPGKHGSFFTDPNVQQLAACVTHCISEATDRLARVTGSRPARSNGTEAAAFEGPAGQQRTSYRLRRNCCSSAPSRRTW